MNKIKKVYVQFLSILSFSILPLFSLMGQVDDISVTKFFMSIDGNTLKIPYYSSQDIYVEDNQIDKIVILIQGSKRNAGPYLENLKIAANNDPEHTQNTLLITPQFLIEEDIEFHNLDSEHLYWTNGGWKSGSNSKDEINNPRPVRIPSYAVLDSLVLHLSQTFSNLESIVMTGHSAGGQVIQRLAATSPMPNLLCEDFEISVRFVPMNPSSYVYMDGQRRITGSNTEFAIPSTSCSEYNEWKYGLEDLYNYADDLGADAIRNIYKTRNVTYLVGEDDDNPSSSSLDDSCEGNWQGRHRLERGKIYFNYLKHYYGAEIESHHNFVEVPLAGHNSLEMMDSPVGRFNLFQNTLSNCGVNVGVEESFSNYQILISPNPNNGNFKIMGIENDYEMPLSMNIYNSFGQLVEKLSRTIDAEINTSELNSGMYFLHIDTKKQKIIRRFIIAHN